MTATYPPKKRFWSTLRILGVIALAILSLVMGGALAYFQRQNQEVTISSTPSCTNGATNYPSCNNNCTNGATNPPSCDNVCANQARNYPDCTSPMLHITGVDIDVYRGSPSFVIACGQGANCGVSPVVNASFAFAFTPHEGFQGADFVLLTLTYSGCQPQPLSSFSIQLNYNSPKITPCVPGSGQTGSVVTTVAGMRPEYLTEGMNILNIGFTAPSYNGGFQAFISQVRLTVEYTYMS